MRYKKLSECGTIGDWIVLNIFGDFERWGRAVERVMTFGLGVLIGYMVR